MSGLVQKLTHSWSLTPRQAIELQLRLRDQIRLNDRFDSPGLVAGADVGFDTRRRMTRAAVVLMDIDTFEVLERVQAEQPTCFPYVPGLLSFREIPAILAAMRKIRRSPDLILCDGQGLAHPRRFGLACHLGLLLDLPCIGIGKTRLIGTYTEPGVQKGSSSALMDGAEQIGTVLRTREAVKPVFVSPGHRVSQQSAAHWVMRCVTRYRLPEPIRAADHLASRRGMSRH